jgi:hypothetical protein
MSRNDSRESAGAFCPFSDILAERAHGRVCSLVSQGLVSRKLRQSCRQVLQRGLTIGPSYGGGCVSADVIEQAFTDVGPVADVFESVTPCMIVGKVLIVHTDLPHPCGQPLSHLRGGGLGLLGRVGVAWLSASSTVEQGTCALRSHKI